MKRQTTGPRVYLRLTQIWFEEMIGKGFMTTKEMGSKTTKTTQKVTKNEIEFQSKHAQIIWFEIFS